jgi:hypothetical protein
MMVTTHLRITPGLRMSGVMPLLPLFTFMACTAATLPFLIQHLLISHIRYKGKGKGKAVPLQAWSGPQGSRK